MLLYFLVAFAGFGLGGWIVYMLVERRRGMLRDEQDALTAERLRLEKQVTESTNLRARLVATQEELDSRAAALSQDRERFDARSITAIELEQESRILKRDLANIHVSLRKLQLDRKEQSEAQAVLDQRSRELANRYLSDVEKWVAGSINANNYGACKQRLTKAVEWSREIGFDVPKSREEELLQTLKADFEREVRAALEREEQARIKSQIREEQQREREVQKELQAIEREKEVLEAALARAMAMTKDVHSQEIENLRARLADAEARAQRTKSQAELTKVGHIYVISNIGSFGERVFKIGMTRRLDPNDRVIELSDASVPFPFDVHMMISCQDAPALENALHRQFQRHRVNRVNPRKEFFKIDLEEIKKFVEAHSGEVAYTADAEALEFRQSLTMSEEDQKFIETVFKENEVKLGVPQSED